MIINYIDQQIKFESEAAFFTYMEQQEAALTKGAEGAPALLVITDGALQYFLQNENIKDAAKTAARGLRIAQTAYPNDDAGEMEQLVLAAKATCNEVLAKAAFAENDRVSELTHYLAGAESMESLLRGGNEECRIPYVRTMTQAAITAGMMEDWSAYERYLTAADAALTKFETGKHDERELARLKGLIASAWGTLYAARNETERALKAFEISAKAYQMTADAEGLRRAAESYGAVASLCEKLGRAEDAAKAKEAALLCCGSESPPENK